MTHNSYDSHILHCANQTKNTYIVLCRDIECQYYGAHLPFDYHSPPSNVQKIFRKEAREKEEAGLLHILKHQVPNKGIIYWIATAFTK